MGMFFQYEEEPEPDGMEVDIDAARRRYEGDAEEGIEIDLSKLPPGVTRIRFYNSW